MYENAYAMICVREDDRPYFFTNTRAKEAEADVLVRTPKSPGAAAVSARIHTSSSLDEREEKKLLLLLLLSKVCIVDHVRWRGSHHSFIRNGRGGDWFT